MLENTLAEKLQKQTLNENLTFIHIPKNYGCSCLKIFFDLKAANSHLTADQASKLPGFESQKYFCFFRNPIDRFVSIYRWRKRPWKEPKNIIHRLSMEKVIDNLQDDTVMGINKNNFLKFEKSDHKLDKMFRSQLFWVNDQTDIFRCENFKQEVFRFAEKYNIETENLYIEHANINNQHGSKEQTKEELFNILRTSSRLKNKFYTFYKRDFDFYESEL